MRPTVFILALAAGCTARATVDPARGAPVAAAAVRVRGVAAQRVTTEDGAALVGRLEPYERAVLAARVAGVVTEVRVDLGDRVRQGQLLAVVNVPGLGAQVEGAVAGDGAARREAELRGDVAARIAAVAAQNRAAASEQEVVGARGALAAAQARVAIAAAEARRLRALMSETHLYAPFDGVVVSRRKDRGASAAAGEGLLEVARVDRLRLRVSVPEAEATFVRVGAPLRVTLPSLGGRQIDVTVSRFAPSLDGMTRMLPVEADVPNPDGALIAGVRVLVRLAGHTNASALTVPSEAVLTEGNASVSYVVVGDRARRRVLRIGYDNGVFAEVADGLAPGDVVLLGGRGLLRDDVPVEVAR